MKKSVFVVVAMCLPLVPLNWALAEEAPAAPTAVPAVPAAPVANAEPTKTEPTKAEQYEAALQNVGELAEAKKWDEARTELERAQTLATTFDERVTVLRQIGQIYVEQEQPEKAWKVWRQVLALPELSRPQNVMLRAVLATSLARSQKWRDARREAERVLKEAPADAPAQMLFAAQSIVGDSLLETGKYAAARRAYDRALTIASDQSIFLIFQSSVGINIAKSYLRDKQPLNARIYLRTALSALPTGAQAKDAAPMVALLRGVAQQMIADSYRDEGDKVHAIAAYHVLTDNPATPEPIKFDAAKQLQELEKSAPAKQK